MYSNQFIQLKLKLIYFVQIVRNSKVSEKCAVLMDSSIVGIACSVYKSSVD